MVSCEDAIPATPSASNARRPAAPLHDDSMTGLPCQVAGNDTKQSPLTQCKLSNSPRQRPNEITDGLHPELAVSFNPSPNSEHQQSMNQAWTGAYRISTDQYQTIAACLGGVMARRHAGRAARVLAAAQHACRARAVPHSLIASSSHPLLKHFVLTLDGIGGVFVLQRAAGPGL